MIKTHELIKIYNKNVSIGPIDLEIPRAGITSIVGPNGAGKSTFLLMVGRLLGYDKGNVYIGDLDIGNSKSEDIAKIAAILKQENHFVTRLTVRQLVSFGRFPHSKGRLNINDEKVISKYIDFLELRDLENRYLDELSGGQRQRAYVAMVLCQETEYVLLDEPLNNLDVARSVAMLKHLKIAAAKFNKTIVMVLHDINFAAQYSDYICAFKNGRVIKFGTPDKIMDSDILTDIFDVNIQVIDGPNGKVAVY